MKREFFGILPTRAKIWKEVSSLGHRKVNATLVKKRNAVPHGHLLGGHIKIF
jgi:hypothetical protein